MIIYLSKYLIYKIAFLNVLVIAYLAKLNRGLDLVYGHIFSMFFCENFLNIKL